MTAGRDYVEGLQGIWSTSWHIEDFDSAVTRSQSAGIPLHSEEFRKLGHLWRLVLFPKEMSFHMQLIANLTSKAEPVRFRFM
ncbi:MAG: hypothetical protein DSY43_04890 [Gammaproteobacteria bacterium]|nr:MAG: hypothetical protein DSY43_04890 [Gammaproteobacteria bacterium]